MGSSVGGLSRATWGRHAACDLAAPAVGAGGCGDDVSWCLVISLASGGEMGRLLAGGGVIIFTLVAASCFSPKHASAKS